MPTTLTPHVAHIDGDLRQAAAALEGARAAARHSPNADTRRAVERCTARIDHLLDRRLRVTRADAAPRG